MPTIHPVLNSQGLLMLAMAGVALWRTLLLRTVRVQQGRRNLIWLLSRGVAGLGLGLFFGSFARVVKLSIKRPKVGAVLLGGVLALGLAAGHAPIAAPATSAGTPGQQVVATGDGAALAAEVGYNAGWRGQDLVNAVAYAGIESTWDRNATSSTGCEGIWQICPPHPDSYDPQSNANQAYGKWRGCDGGSFSCDWTPYDLGPSNPAWDHDYVIAQAAVAKLPNGGN